MKFAIAIGGIACLSCVSLHSAECTSLSLGGELRRIPARTGLSACFLVRVAAGEGVQIYAQQPADIALVVSSGGIRQTFDGFEFGTETGTLVSAGDYRVDIRASNNRRHPIQGLWVGLRSLPLPQAAQWRDAEAKATESKKTGEPSTLAESLALWKVVGEESEVARTYLKIGDAQYERADAQSALTSYEQANEICRVLKDIRCGAEAENNIGVTAQQLANFDLAKGHLQKAAEGWHLLAEFGLEGMTFSNLGLMYSQTGDYQRAVSVLERSSAILRGRDLAAYAKTLNTLGLCYMAMGEFKKAHIRFAPALGIFASRGLRPDAIRVTQNLGRLYLLEGQMIKARKTLERALQEANKDSDKRVIADVLNNLGQLSLTEGSVAEAKQKFEGALQIDRQLADTRAEAYDIHYLGLVHQRLGETGRAREMLLEAFEVRKSVGLLDDAAESMSALTSLEAEAADIPAALDHAEQALTLLESVRARVPIGTLRATYYSRKRRLFDEIVDLVVASPGSQAAEPALLTAERGRARSLLDSMSAGGLLRVPPKQLDQLAEVQHRIDLLAVKFSNADRRRRAEIRVEIESAVAESGELEAAIRLPLEERNFGHPLQSAEQLRSRLPHDSALVEFYLGEKRSYVWLVKAESILMADLPPRGLIEAHVSRAIELLGRVRERRDSPKLNRSMKRDLDWLSGALFGPFAHDRLPKTIVIVPDGALHRFPFAAINLPHEVKALGLLHDLIEVPAASFLLTVPSSPPPSAFPQSVLAIVDPVFDASDSRVSARSGRPVSTGSLPLPRLSFAGEITTIKALIPASRFVVLRGFDASRGRMNGLKLGDFAVLHFSTHALIDDQVPELSRVALSLVTQDGQPDNGFLRPYHFGEFRLHGSVVVLSACSTALGKEVTGEGLVGFSTSLFQAGASKLVLTLTDTDAESSSQFFSEVYRRYLGRNPVSIQRAITMARNSMSRSIRWSDPYYWANIILIGAPGNR